MYKIDLPERLLAIRETVSEWDAPITAMEDLKDAAEELKQLRFMTGFYECKNRHDD